MKTRFLSCVLLLHCSSHSMNQAQQGTDKSRRYGSLQAKAPLLQRQRSHHQLGVDLVIRTQSPGGRTYVHCVSSHADQK